MKLEAYGITVELPSGWEGRIYRRPGGDPTLHAANFPLPADDADFGSGTVASMRDGSVFVVLTEYERSLAGQGLFQPNEMPIPIRAGDFSHTALQRALPGLAGLQRFFTAGRRAWCLYVVLGAGPDAKPLVRETNLVLRTVSLAAP